MTLARILGACALAASLVFATACGSDNNAPAADGGAVSDGGGGGGGTDGGSRADGGGGSDDGGPAGTSEGEAANERNNDTLATAKTIAVGATIDGTIGTPVTDASGTTNDVDVFKFTAAAGDVFRLTLAQRSDYAPAAIIRNQDGSYSRVLIGATDTDTSATRQFYVPAAGDYFIQVLDARNTGDSPADVGGASNTYRFTLVRETVTPTAVTLPVAARAGSLSDDNQVLIFSFTGAAGGGVSAEVRAGRLTPASTVDTVLYLIDATGSAPAVLAFNDDIDSNGGIYDSRVRAVAAHAGSHLVVLDHYIAGAAPKTYEIDITTFDPGVEQEPNDGLSTANTITAPTMSTPAQVSGAINKTDMNGALATDVDLFQFDAVEGTYYEISVTKPSGSNAAFVPYVLFVDGDGNVTFANVNKAGRPSARLEAYAYTTGPHYIAVLDARNAAQGSTPVGGADYTYQVRASIISRSVTALGTVPVTTAAQTRVDAGGQTRWFSFVVPTGSLKQHALDLDLGAGAGGNGIALAPFVTLIGTDGKTILAQTSSLYLPDLTLEPGTYTLAVSDADGDFDTASPGTHAFKPRIVATGSYTTLTDDGSHGTAANALPVNGDLVVVNANLTAGGVAFYNLGTLTAGTAVSLITGPGAGGATVDTKITLLTAAGAAVPDGTNDDQGLFGSVFAQLVEFPVPATGGYVLKVEGGGASAAGPYALTVKKNLCGGDSPTRIFINEVLANPGSGAGGDANGDGSTNASDEFVELVNAGRNAANLGGMILRDLSGARVRFGCAATIAGGLPLTVLGGCAANTCTAGRAQSNATPDNPAGTSATATGLDLDDAAEAVFLLSRTGAIVDRVTVGASTAGTSFARGTGGVCDAAPAAGSSATAVQLHSACTGATGRVLSPGKKANNTDFVAPPALTNDACAMATALTAGALLEGQDTTTFTSDYDASMSPSAACDPNGLSFPGKDAAFSISVPAGKLLTVVVTPNSAWDPAVAIVSDCSMAGPSCLGLVDDGVDGDPETVTFRNSGASARQVFVIVDSYSASAFGEFSIRATIAD